MQQKKIIKIPLILFCKMQNVHLKPSGLARIIRICICNRTTSLCPISCLSFSFHLYLSEVSCFNQTTAANANVIKAYATHIRRECKRGRLKHSHTRASTDNNGKRHLQFISFELSIQKNTFNPVFTNVQCRNVRQFHRTQFSCGLARSFVSLELFVF